MLCGVALPSVAAAQGPAVFVDSSAERCGSELERAIDARLPSLQVQTAGTPSGDDLAISLAAQDDHWDFVIRRSTGDVALTRQVERSDDCSVVADVCALMLERFLHDINWTGLPAIIDAPRTEPEPPVIEAVVAMPPRTRRRSVRRYSIAGGPALAAGIGPIEMRYGITVEGSVRVDGTDIRVIALAYAPRSSEVVFVDPRLGQRTLGTVTVTPLAVAAGLGRCGGTRWAACGSLLAGAAIYSARSRGTDLHRPQRTTAAAAVAGLEASVRYRASKNTELSLAVATITRFPRLELTVEGIDDPVYRSPRLELATLVTARRFF